MVLVTWLSPLLLVYKELNGVDTVVISAPSNILFKTVYICLTIRGTITIFHSVFRVRLIGCMQLVQLSINTENQLCITYFIQITALLTQLCELSPLYHQDNYVSLYTFKSDSIHHFFRNACTKSGPLEDCSVFGNFVITLIHIEYT